MITNIEGKIRELHLQLQTQLNYVIKEIQNIKQQKTTLIRLLADGIISQEDYREVVQQNEETLTKLSNNKLELEQQMTLQDHHSQMRQLQKELENCSHINVLTPEILHRLIKRIEIKADGTARIFIDSRCHLLLFNVTLTTHSTPHESYAGTYQQVVLPVFYIHLLLVLLNHVLMLLGYMIRIRRALASCR